MQARIPAVRFVDPGGSMTGTLFPTGNLQDDLKVPATCFPPG
jgi:2-methylaconitate cis-trans-isomerase PrpF